MPGLSMNKSTEILIEGNYNHGNDIKELSSSSTDVDHHHNHHHQPPPLVSSAAVSGSLVSQNNGLISSCSSISGSVSAAADVANFHSSTSTSTSGLSSTRNILSTPDGGGSSCRSSWAKMQHRLTWRHAMDLFMVLTLGVLLALIETNVIPVFKRGFFCGDRTIDYKFTGDTVSIATILIVTLLVPIFVFWVFELLAGDDNESGKTPAWKSSFYRALRVYRDYMIGQIICLAVVSVMKTCYGGLRPHFLDTCQPNNLATCTPNEFVTDFYCTNYKISKFNLLDSRKSFPSGHSSLSVFQAIFTVYYLQMRFCRLTTNTAMVIVQFGWLSWGIFCSISRITDYRHHWWDVLFGACLGIIFAVLTCSIVSKNFGYLNKSKSPVRVANGVGSSNRRERLLNPARSDV